MRSAIRIAVLLLAPLMLPSLAGALPLATSYAEIVDPDPELTKFLRQLVDTARAGMGTQSRAYALLDAMIAPKVRGFTRGLDPFEPWMEVDTSSLELGGGIDLLTSRMIEQGELPEDTSVLPDYRQDFLQLLAALVANPHKPLGRMPEMGNAVCSPARYNVDTSKARAFAEANDTDGYGIYIFPRELELHAEPQDSTPVTATIAPLTLLVTDYQSNQPDGWIKVIASEGTVGWAQDLGDYEGLSQQHLCFDKVDSEYKIVGFYSYGL